MNTTLNHVLNPKKGFQRIILGLFVLWIASLISGCTVLSVADAAVSGTISVVSTGVSAASSVVKAVLPSGKEAAK